MSDNIPVFTLTVSRLPDADVEAVGHAFGFSCDITIHNEHTRRCAVCFAVAAKAALTLLEHEGLRIYNAGEPIRAAAQAMGKSPSEHTH